jgi:hypothetical protein
MKRSEVNRQIQSALDFAESLQFRLPPFARWTPQEWACRGHEADEIRHNRLGWDITDFGGGDFRRQGLTLFTIRNGNPKVPTAPGRPAKTYCEKLLIADEDQVTPMHFHWSKMEDIINRGGGILVIEVHQATRDETLSPEPVPVSVDGVVRTVPAGTKIELHPGESITLPPYLYHAFWAKKGRGRVLSGEVSAVNDDERDNRFLEPLGRFPAIEEDEPPRFLLCNEYPAAR